MANPEDKVNEIAAIVCDVAREVLKEVLRESISEHYSERDWDTIILNTSIQLTSHLRRSYTLSQAVCKNDLYTPEGRVNMEAVIAAFEDTAKRITSPAHQAQLQFLTQHLTHSFQGLKQALRRAS